MLIFSFANLYAHEWKCPMLSKLCFFDVLGPTINFSRVAVGNLHPAHQRSKAPISPWPVLHFWFGHFFPHGPFARWEARLLWSTELPFQVAWLAKKGVCVFFLNIFRKKRIRPFWPRASLLSFALFMGFQGDSNLPPDICFLQFCLAFKSSSLPSLNIFVDESYHL